MKKIFLMTAAAALLLVGVPAAQAKGPLVGVSLIHCAVNLDHFPATAKATNSNDCVGTASGVFAGLGTKGAVAGVAVNAAFDATVQYDETCLAGEPPLVGFANGHINVAPVTVVDQTGTIDPNGSFATSYDWTRVGLVALIFDGKLATKKAPLQSTLTYSGGTANDAEGSVALAAFAPQLGLGNVCPSGTPLQADVVAVDLGA